jgi:hypothetical protein
MADRYNISIDQGATFSLVVTWKDSLDTPVNLTGYTARMQARQEYTSPNPPLFSLTSPIGGIVINAAQGQVAVTIEAQETTNFAAGKYVYDLEIVSGAGVVTRLIEGRCVVNPEVTK